MKRVIGSAPPSAPPSSRNVRRVPREPASSPDVARDEGSVDGPVKKRKLVSATEPRPSPSPPAPTGPRRESRVLRGARALLGFALIVSIGGAGAWGARRYVKTSPRFGVAEIVTSGGKRRSPEELAVTAGVAKGDNVFSIDLEGARARLLADPWISEASLSRQLPGTIFVRVTEREAAGLLSTATKTSRPTSAKSEGEGTRGGEAGEASAAGAASAASAASAAGEAGEAAQAHPSEAPPSGETYVVARDGSIIKRIDAGDPADLTIVTGVTLNDLVADREGATRTVRRALDLASDYEHSPLARRAPLEEVHVEQGGDMTLVVGKSAVSLKMGAGPYRRKLEQAVRVMAELDRRGAKPDTIMLDSESRTDRVVVRMR